MSKILCVLNLKTTYSMCTMQQNLVQNNQIFKNYPFNMQPLMCKIVEKQKVCIKNR